MSVDDELLSTESAANIVTALESQAFPAQDISPSVENGITFSWWKGNRYASLEVYDSGEILAAIRDENDKPVIIDVQMSGLTETIGMIRAYVEGSPAGAQPHEP